MYYSIRHVTTFHYTNVIRESIMELRMQPRSERAQRCLHFQLVTHPKARLLSFVDFHGNTVHYFDIPRDHNRLMIAAEAVVELRTPPLLPSALPPASWAVLDQMADDKDFFDMLTPSHFAQPTALLHALGQELGVCRRDDPLTVLRELNSALYEAFDYAPQSTHVDSPIDDALAQRKGVCQDFAHIMIALVRGLGIPCRYISGYLYHVKDQHDRSEEDATHAWVEAWLPDLGWVGFDPTNNVLCAERHIRVSIGRDYADVPPTRGVFKGETESELSVSVQVEQMAELPTDLLPVPALDIPPDDGLPATQPTDESYMQQQQQ